jgi:hypothetical protein
MRGRLGASVMYNGVMRASRRSKDEGNDVKQIRDLNIIFAFDSSPTLRDLNIMLIYNKNYHGLPTLFNLFQSPLLRTFLPALISILPPLFLPSITIDHPWTYQPFSFIVGFGIIFRVNLSYERYWSGITSVRLGISKLADGHDMYESFLPSSSIVNTTSTPNIANPKLPELRNLLTVHLAVHLQSLRLPIPFLSIPFVEVLTPYELILSAPETHPLTKHNPKVS